MDAGIYFPLFIVITNYDRSAHAVHYLPADLQHPEMFQERKPSGRRPDGWGDLNSRPLRPEANARFGVAPDLPL
jgi:hypothetical protein